jgi:hypothetical protein
VSLRPAVRIVFAPMSHRYGTYRRDGRKVLGDTRGRVVRVDPRSGTPARILLHELLHVQHPSWSEATVLVEERRRWARMSWRGKARLYQMLGSARLEGDSE